MDDRNRWRRPFLLGAGASFLASVITWFLIDREAGVFIGIWVPSILSLGSFLGTQVPGR
jgi:hypothetical protein